MSQVGHSGLDLGHTGFINDDFLREMQGQRKYKNLNEMRLSSPIVGAAMAAIKYPIQNIGWFFTSAEGNDDPRLELLNEAKDGLRQSWGNHIMEALTMLDFGFAPMAIQYKRDGGRVLWDRFMMLGQDTVMRWVTGSDGDIEALQQYPHIFPAPIPIERVLLCRINVERNNPEGRSILRQGFVPFYYTKQLQKIEAIGYERGLAGLPVITLPPGADPDESSSTSDAYKAAKIVRNIRHDESAGIVLPSEEWDLSLLSTGINVEMAINTAVQRHEARILMSMLSQFLMLGFTQTGTQAKATIDKDLFNLLVGSIADVISDSHTRQSIPRLMALNGMAADGLMLEHSPPGDKDLTQIAEFMEKAVNIKALTITPEDEAMLREIAMLPEKTPEEIAMLQEQDQAERAERQATIAGMMQPRNDGEDGDEFAIKLPPASVANNAPDDDERLKDERREYMHRWPRLDQTIVTALG